MAFWSTKAAISLKRVKIEKNHYGEPIGTHIRSFERYHPGLPTASPSPRLGVRTPPKTSITIISGTGMATNFKFGQYIQRVHVNKSPLKFLEKRERGRIEGLPLFLGTPYYLRNGKSYGFQTWPVHSEGPSKQKPIISFGEKGAWAYPGTAQFFRVPSIISGTGKATDFKFGQYIQRVHPNKSPL